MWQPRTFIVHFYPNGNRTAGLVEDSGSGKRFRFIDKDELWALMHRPVLLQSPKARGRRHAGKTVKPRPNDE